MKTKLKFYDSSMNEISCKISENADEANKVKKEFVLNFLEFHKKIIVKSISVDKNGIVDKSTKIYLQGGAYHKYLLSVFNKKDQENDQESETK